MLTLFTVLETLGKLLDLLIAGLGGMQIVETWYHGEPWQPFIEKCKKIRKDMDRSWLIRKAAKLVSCPFCLSHWTCLLCAYILWANPWDSWWRFFVYWQAVVRFAWLVNDLTGSFTRSPSDDEDEEVVEVDQTSEVDAVEILDQPRERG